MPAKTKTMKKIIGLSLLACIVGVSNGADNLPSVLPRSTPEAQGISSAAILDFIEAADKQVNAMHSFVLVRHGHVVAEGW